MLAAVETLGAVDGDQVGADALDVGAHLHEHPRQILDVRLAGGVADHGGAGRQRGRHQRVLGGHHRRLVHEHVGRAQAARCAQHDLAFAIGDARPSRGRRPGAGSRRRRPITSPPGGDITARWKRASSGPGEQERRPDRLGQLGLDLDLAHVRPRTARPRWARASSRRTPIATRISIIASTSRMRGTLRTITSSSVRTLAARIGSAPFLFPAGTIVPDSGTPPSMTNFSMSFGRRLAVNEDPPVPPVERLASVTAISRLSSRPCAWAPAYADAGAPARPRNGRLQLLLHGARPGNGAAAPFLGAPTGYVHAFAGRSVRTRRLSYEHMFSRHPTSQLAQRALGALRVARSFLLLEDDYDVDWEVGQDEPRHGTASASSAAARRACAQRRAGQLPAPPQACLSPVGAREPRHSTRHGRDAPRHKLAAIATRAPTRITRAWRSTASQPPGSRTRAGRPKAAR